ncbi:MAG: hypothetical protein J2P48_16385 [Alphaproteobacteria bacterium]|nr:hypothetical protein [Alphaproteobacteria bacterium]
MNFGYGYYQETSPKRIDDQVHQIRAVVGPHIGLALKVWKTSSSHCINQELATIWLDK